MKNPRNKSGGCEVENKKGEVISILAADVC